MTQWREATSRAFLPRRDLGASATSVNAVTKVGVLDGGAPANTCGTEASRGTLLAASHRAPAGVRAPIDRAHAENVPLRQIICRPHPRRTPRGGGSPRDRHR